MTRKPSSPPASVRPQAQPPRSVAKTPLSAKNKQPKQGLVFSGIIVLGLLVLAFTIPLLSGWLHNVQHILTPTSTPVSIQTLRIQRAASYAGLLCTVIDARYATSFPDDSIQPGQTIVRLDMQITNASSYTASIIYYDAVHLLAPHLAPIAPTNVSLPVGPKPRTSANGWIDFAAPRGLQLVTLKLQFGSALLNESFVTIPFTGSFNPAQYNDRTSHQNLALNYDFPYNNRHLLIYHLTSVDIRFSYQGTQCKSGQQYYILNFSVENPNTIAVQPGYAFDYMRLLINGNPQPPLDSTLPYGFNSGAKNTGGHVVFMAPQGLNALTIEFLVQYGSSGTDYIVSL